MKKQLRLLLSFLAITGLFICCNNETDVTMFTGEWIESGSGELFIDDKPYGDNTLFRKNISVSHLNDNEVLIEREDIDIIAMVEKKTLLMREREWDIDLPDMDVSIAYISGKGVLEDGVVHLNYKISGEVEKDTNSRSNSKFVIKIKSMWRRQ